MAMSIKSSVIFASLGMSFTVGICSSVSTVSTPELSVADSHRYMVFPLLL